MRPLPHPVCLGITVILSSLFLSGPLPATDLRESQKLLTEDAEPFDQVGNAVALCRRVALVGASADADARGSAYVFRFDGTTWNQEQKLVGPAPRRPQDRFALAVATHRDVALVGAPFDDDTGENAGSVSAFRFDGTTWIHEQTLFPSDPSPEAHFGRSIAVIENLAFVSAEGVDGDTGATYVFRHDGVMWREEQRITASDGAPRDRFGFSVSTDGETLLVGSFFDEDSVGAAYAYRFDGATWVEDQKITASDGEQLAQFGVSVSVHENLALIGANGEDTSTGSAYVFRHDGMQWVEEAKVRAPVGAPFDQFGISTAIRGDVAMVAAPGSDNTIGAAYVFVFDGTSWAFDQKLGAEDADTVGFFGSSVSLNGFRGLIGSTGDDDAGLASGAAYIFDGKSCATGTVNAGNDLVIDVLYINGSNGGPDRIVELAEGDLVVLTVIRPFTGGTGRFVVHANEGMPTLATPTALPFEIGSSCFPLLVPDGAAPVIVANNIGRPGQVGTSEFFGVAAEDPPPAPTDIFYPALLVGTELTFQGVISDPGSASAREVSATNAVVVRVVP